MTAIAACRTCGTEPREGARFCDACGSLIAPATEHAEVQTGDGALGRCCSLDGHRGNSLQAILTALAVLMVHTYHGYYASGGPSGVGVTVGTAVRTSLVVVISVTLLVSLAVYGTNGNFHLWG